MADTSPGKISLRADAKLRYFLWRELLQPIEKSGHGLAGFMYEGPFPKELPREQGFYITPMNQRRRVLRGLREHPERIAAVVRHFFDEEELASFPPVNPQPAYMLLMTAPIPSTEPNMPAGVAGTVRVLTNTQFVFGIPPDWISKMRPSPADPRHRPKRESVEQGAEEDVDQLGDDGLRSHHVRYPVLTATQSPQGLRRQHPPSRGRARARPSQAPNASASTAWSPTMVREQVCSFFRTALTAP